MPILSTTVIHQIYVKSLEIGLERQRDVLLSSIPESFVAMMAWQGVPGEVLLANLSQLNRDINLVIIDGVTPLAEWLLTAKALSASYPATQRFFSDRADEVAAKALVAGGLPGQNALAAARVTDLPERIIGRNDLMPVSFLERGAAAARSIVRLRVPLCVGGSLRLDHSRTAKGTGWLIGPRHLLTNHHVVAARDRGHPTATVEAVAIQAMGTEAEFDYVSELRDPAFTLKVESLVLWNETLDYALLELAEPVIDREPSTIVRKPIDFFEGDTLAVNVVQHPRGAEKQIAIRNNLVAALRGPDLAYYADTEAGSSGSPVFDDHWCVIAMHKAATQRYKDPNSNPTSDGWVNVGTPIHLIVKDLESRLKNKFESLDIRFA